MTTFPRVTPPPPLVPLVPRVQVVRGVPVQYANAKAVFTVPERAENVRFAAKPRTPNTGATRVWTVKIRPAPASVGGFDDLAPAGFTHTIAAGAFITAAIDVTAANEVVLECTTGEGGSVDLFEDVVASFDRGGLTPSERPYR